MNLTTAGILAGAGNSAKESLQEQQKFNLLEQLEQSRQAMENMRQERNLSAQRQMHLDQIKAAAEQGELNRGQEERLAKAHNDILKDIEQKRAESAEANLGQQISSHEAMAELNRESQERIANQANKTKERELTLADQHATLTSLNKELKELREDNSMIAVKMATLASDPLKTTDNPEYKALSVMYKRNLGLIAGYSDRLSKQLGVSVPVGGDAVPERPPIKNAFGVPSNAPTSPSVKLPAPGSAQATPPYIPQPGQGLMQSILPPNQP